MDAIEQLKIAIYQVILTNGLNAYWLQAPLDGTNIAQIPSGAVVPYIVLTLTNAIVNRMSSKEMIDFIIHMEAVAYDSQTAQQKNTYIYSLFQDKQLYMGTDWQNYYTRRIRLGAVAQNIEGTQLYKSSNYFEFKVVKGE